MGKQNRTTLKTLVVEDDFMVRKVVRDILELNGAFVDIAVNGEEAVQAFRIAIRKKEPYELICMDIMMPIMDGQEALVKIREIEKKLGIAGPEEVKVIMLSALDDAKTVVKAYYKGGATSYIVKPIESDRLISEIKSLGLMD